MTNVRLCYVSSPSFLFFHDFVFVVFWRFVFVICFCREIQTQTTLALLILPVVICLSSVVVART